LKFEGTGWLLATAKVQGESSLLKSNILLIQNRKNITPFTGEMVFGNITQMLNAAKVSKI
jgi:hypothetical protein